MAKVQPKTFRKFPYAAIGDLGVAFLFNMGSRDARRYLRAVEVLVDYGNTSYAQVIQDIDANGIRPSGAHLYSWDPDSYSANADLRAELMSYGDEREKKFKK